ncbi:hypothetical protein QWY16_09835 [Planococcus shenhongbingii]|uniref:hypothetical protein n=1 Tax=Planococcus shenhongbingii TaxID=3058398 RepID=UPI00260CFD57|nr:hypothetical protein [Planococcus sp. N016]WKA60463.1 hypothetical protein QWY16_09835 [Planococcus sp. N016]
MKNTSQKERIEAIKAFESTIRKSENALANMAEKGASTTLIKKRLHALYIGLAVLETAWNQKQHHYTQKDLAEARHVLTGLFPSLESSYGKSKDGSPQKTLLERRMKALELAVQAINDLANK